MTEIKISLKNCIGSAFYGIHHKIKREEFDEYWLKGGRGSLKSSFTSIEIILGIMKDPEANAVVFRRYDNELRESVFGQLQWAAIKLGVDHLWNFGTSPMKATYLPTKQVIIFKGADNPKKIKSINLGRGYVKYLWFEEVDQFGGMEDIRSIVQSTLRGMAPRKRVSFYSYNPPKSARSWVNAEVKIPKPGRYVHHSTYLDAPQEWLGDRFIAEAEHLRDTRADVYRHEYLGEEIGTGLEVFNNVTIRQITDDEIAVFENTNQGLDWGYSIDPLVFTKNNFDRKKKRLWIYYEFAGIKITEESLNNHVGDEERNALTIADSSEPRTNDKMVDVFGWNLIGATKGQGSREAGFRWLAETVEEIIIDPVRCPLAAKEFINYSLDVRKDGTIVSKYPDKDDHTIDATRYSLQDEIRGVSEDFFFAMA